MSHNVLSVRVLLQIILFVVVAPFLPLLISWRWGWWEAWVYAVVCILGFAISRAVAGRRHPDLLAERGRMLRHDDAKPWDKVLAPLVGLGGALMSADKSAYHVLRLIHNVAPFVAVGGLSVAIYLLGGGSCGVKREA